MGPGCPRGRSARARSTVDVVPDGVSQAEEVARLVVLGVRVLMIVVRPAADGSVMADPLGNEFCGKPNA